MSLQVSDRGVISPFSRFIGRCGIASPIGGPAGVLWAPTSEGTGTERVGFECVAGTGLGIVVLLAEGDGDSSEAHAPCTGRGGWVPVRNWTGCKWTVSGRDGTTIAGRWVVRLDG